MPATQVRSALNSLEQLLAELRRELFTKYRPDKRCMRGLTPKDNKENKPDRNRH